MYWLRQFFSVRVPNNERWLTLANCLTMSRILLIPFIVANIYERDWEQATFLFVCASLTDLFDGMIARWRSEVTLLGAFLDPIADKLMLLSCIGALAATPSPFCTIPGWFFSLLVTKEIALIGGIVCLLSLGCKLELAPTFASKWATTLHMSLLCIMMWCIRMHWALPHDFANILLAITAIATCAALVQYAYVGFRILVKSALRGGL